MFIYQFSQEFPNQLRPRTEIVTLDVYMRQGIAILNDPHPAFFEGEIYEFFQGGPVYGTVMPIRGNDQPVIQTEASRKAPYGLCPRIIGNEPRLWRQPVDLFDSLVVVELEIHARVSVVDDSSSSYAADRYTEPSHDRLLPC